MDTWKPRSLILGQRLYLSTHHKKIRKKWERDRERESETEILTKLEGSVDSPNGLKQISSFLCFYPQFFCWDQEISKAESFLVQKPIGECQRQAPSWLSFPSTL